MSRRSATAPLSLGRLMPPEPPATADRTARQIPGYLLFLANWANAAGLVPRRLAGTNAPHALWVAQSLPSVRFEEICLLRTPAFHAMLGRGSWPRSNRRSYEVGEQAFLSFAPDDVHVL